MAAAIAVALIGWQAPSTATAAVIESQVGIEAVGGVGIPFTLTGGFLDQADDLAWTHSYGAPALAILSATLRIDTIDGDDGFLDLYAGTDATGLFIGTATGIDQGLPGPWRDLQSPPGPNPGDGAFDNLINIDPAHFADLADGTFQIFAVNRNQSLGDWGGNRALLTITTAIPEPSAVLLVAGGLIGIAVSRRRGRNARR